MPDCLIGVGRVRSTEGEDTYGQHDGECKEDRHPPRGSPLDALADTAIQNPGIDGHGQDKADIGHARDPPGGLRALEVGQELHHARL
jgi:hypothetical protein